MACKTTCIKCNRSFTRYSGLLLNLDDSILPTFYNLPIVKESIHNGKHTTLCVDCLTEELGRPLKLSEIKFKNGKVMTCTVTYLIAKHIKDVSERLMLLLKVEDDDKCGCLPYKKSQFKECLEYYGLSKIEDPWLE